MLAALLLLLAFAPSIGGDLTRPLAVAPPSSCGVPPYADFPDPLRALSGNDLSDASRSALAGDLPAVRSRLIRALRWSPGRGADAYGPADSLFRDGRYPRAFRAYFEEIFCHPDPLPSPSFSAPLPSLAGIGIETALLSASRGRYSEARSRIEAVLASNAAIPEAWFFDGQLALAEGRPEAALRAWRSAVALGGYGSSVRSAGAALTDAIESLASSP